MKYPFHSFEIQDLKLKEDIVFHPLNLSLLCLILTQLLLPVLLKIKSLPMPVFLLLYLPQVLTYPIQFSTIHMNFHSPQNKGVFLIQKPLHLFRSTLQLCYHDKCEVNSLQISAHCTCTTQCTTKFTDCLVNLLKYTLLR